MHRGCYICERPFAYAYDGVTTECGEIVCNPCTTDPNDIIVKEEGDGIYYYVNRGEDPS